MPAPDLPLASPHHPGERAMFVHLHTRLTDPAMFAGAVVIVIDALRASVTITAALRNGAREVVPVLTVEAALAEAAKFPREETILGGERGGVLIDGFDVDNSPEKYTRDRVARKVVIFTTTNGTASLLHARGAAEIVVGSFANISAVCSRVAPDPRPVHILCAGTREEISLDDVLPAGAMVDRLLRAGRQFASDDSARIALAAYRDAVQQPGGVTSAMRASRGGRNLDKIGLGHDVDFCSTPDTLPVVPLFDASEGRITLR